VNESRDTVTDRPYTILSCAISVDGCLDDTSSRRLILSGPEDLDGVDALRAASDAILVGAGTIRADDPRLLVRSAARGAVRLAGGLPAHPVRVTLTASGALAPTARFFTGPGGPPLVYCGSGAVGPATARLSGTAVVIDAGELPSLRTVLHDLSKRNISTLLLEGGARLLTDALSGGLVDELRLAVAPFFVGDPAAPRFALPGRYPRDARAPMRLESVQRLGDVVVSRYRLTGRERPPSIPLLDLPGVGILRHNASSGLSEWASPCANTRVSTTVLADISA
jgi:5-amino-6-(5-phosphoribosylamino)uracil reductase